MVAGYLERFFRVVWVIPVLLLALSIIPPAFGLGVGMWYFVLVGGLVGMEHFEVGIGVAPSDAVGWAASAVIYLVLCAAIAGVWQVLVEERPE
jgi:hypothetical protein